MTEARTTDSIADRVPERSTASDRFRGRNTLSDYLSAANGTKDLAEVANGRVSSSTIDALGPFSPGMVKPLPAPSLAHMLAGEPVAGPIGLERFKAEVRAWADRIGTEAPAIRVRPMTRAWASCSPRGRLTFDARLLSQPRPFRGEVILQELLELLQRTGPNHDPLFKTLLRPGDERR
jgi:hypothetical protein